MKPIIPPKVGTDDDLEASADWKFFRRAGNNFLAPPTRRGEGPSYRSRMQESDHTGKGARRSYLRDPVVGKRYTRLCNEQQSNRYAMFVRHCLRPDIQHV